jgi:hypothetical protein
MNDTAILIITSIATSIVAAFIFWLIFNYIPERSRYNKIRPKLEYDIYEIYSSLFQFIQLPFKFNNNSPADKQAEIFAGVQKIEDFELALYSKCLNDSYKAVDAMASNLMSIGADMDSISLKICQNMQQLYVFNQYLSTNEVLLCRKITAKLRAYSYDSIAGVKVGNQTLYPVNPTISYMSKNLFELYSLFTQLQEIVLHYRKIDDSISNNVITNISFRRIMNCYYRSEYKKCLRLIKKCKKDDQVWGFKFLSFYNTGKKNNAIKYLTLRLPTTDLKLIYQRGTFRDCYMKEDIKRALLTCRSETEYVEMVNCIESEQAYSDQMVAQAKSFREHYKVKRSNQINRR